MRTVRPTVTSKYLSFSPVSLVIPQDRRFPPVSSPLFFGAALKDVVCIPAIGAPSMKQPSLKDHNVTIKEYDKDHWLILHPETAEAVKRDLNAWIEDVVKPSVAKTYA